MCADEFDREDFEDTVRSIAHEISESVERLAGQVDVDELAGYVGVDPDRARTWVESAASWFGGQLENLGEEFASRGRPTPFGGHREPSATQSPSTDDDPLRGAAPNPLDLPTDEQGQALAALESGRWAVETGTQRLIARGEGPAPSDALGLVRELRARDWIAPGGELTLAGRRALARWLDSAKQS